MKRLFTNLVFVCLAGILASVVTVSSRSVSAEEKENDSKPIVYGQERCAYCTVFFDFIEKHGLADEVIKKNVTTDPKANEEYTGFMKEHRVPYGDQGTPFMVYEGEKWMSGSTPLIDYFKQKFGIENDDYTNGNGVSQVDSPKPYGLGDYLTLGVGLAVVLFIAGYGILNVVNGRAKR